MARQEWITGREAAKLLSEKSGHTVSPVYVRVLAAKGKIARRTREGYSRTVEYNRRDVEKYGRVGQHREKTVDEDHAA